MQTGAIVLCGGQSSRMGQDKALLPFGPELMLPRVVRLLGDVVDRRSIVVVASPGQELPPLPEEVIVTFDGRPGRGPLEGLAAGFKAVPGDVEAVFVTSCDVPLLVPAFVRKMFDLLGDDAIAVPDDGEHVHPLAAAYRPSALSAVEDLLRSDRLSVRSLFDVVRTRFVSADDLRTVDPELRTLRNLNRPDDYQAALALAGFDGALS